MKAICLLCLLLAVGIRPAMAQNETAFGAELRREREEIKDSCTKGTLKGVGDCVVAVATQHPLHPAFGSIAPQSGFGAGLALVGHTNALSEDWRVDWNADGIATPGGSWRGGAYVMFNRSAVSLPTVTTGDVPAPTSDAIHPYPTFSAYVQETSLRRLSFYGLGAASREADESFWSLGETIVGGRAVVPMKSGRSNLALLGALNGRFAIARGTHADQGRSIEQLFDEAATPGLGRHSRFVQFTGGVRLTPSFGTHVRAHYSLTFDRFIAITDQDPSFGRFTVDVKHEFPLYSTFRSTTPSDTNGPDECFAQVGDDNCPTISRDRDGAFTVRLLLTSSMPGDEQTIPFYLQPTLGGGDLNGATLLAGFRDYRFRGPNQIALQETFDHSLPIWALGFMVMAEQGKVTADRHDLGFSDLFHSYSAGLTVRAGGFPMVLALLSWSSEGHHYAVTVNTSLLGGSSRPSLF